MIYCLTDGRVDHLGDLEDGQRCFGCLSRHVLGLDSCCRLIRWWLRFDMIQDLLDYVWVSDVGDDTHSSTTQRAQGNINIKDSLESLSPG